VRPSSADKATVAQAILRDIQETPAEESPVIGSEVDFLFCVGDGKTDESIFGLLNNSDYCISCTVGKKKTKAHYYLDSVDEVKKFLKFLTEK
jgi:trehalose 6-phosphate synthase/phosphatase